jgi:hypothetical protein
LKRRSVLLLFFVLLHQSTYMNILNLVPVQFGAQVYNFLPDCFVRCKLLKGESEQFFDRVYLLSTLPSNKKLAYTAQQRILGYTVVSLFCLMAQMRKTSVYHWRLNVVNDVGDLISLQNP